MKLGIYIGSFNPPHKGHIYVVNYLLDNDVVDKVLIVPTENYWDKNNLVDINHRINMLKFYENESIMVDTKNNGYAYTYELMRKLSEDYYKDILYLVIGADNIINFDKWKNYKELLNYNIIIMNRDGINIEECIKKYPEGNFIILKEFNPINISSTELRENLDNRYLDDKVIQYVKEHNLYK